MLSMGRGSAVWFDSLTVLSLGAATGDIAIVAKACLSLLFDTLRSALLILLSVFDEVVRPCWWSTSASLGN